MDKPNAHSIAVDELAAEQLHAQFPREVTADDAREYVTPCVFTAWIAQQRSLQGAFLDVMEAVSPDGMRAVMCALMLGNEPKVASVLHSTLVDYIARDLAHDANEAIRNYEPTDEEMARGPSHRAEVDDPFLTEERSFTARHNRLLSAHRVIR